MTLGVAMPFRYSTKDLTHERSDCPHEDGYANAHCSSVRSSYKLKTTQRSFNKGMNTRTVVSSLSGKLPGSKADWATDSWIGACNTDESLRYCGEQKNPDTEEYIPRDSTYRKFSKDRNRDRRKLGDGDIRLFWQQRWLHRWMYLSTFVNLHLKSVHFTACKLCFNIYDFKEKNVSSLIKSISRS